MAVCSSPSHQSRALPRLCSEPCWTPISHASTGHVALCLCLQSRSVGEVWMLVWLCLIFPQHQQPDDKKHAFSRINTPQYLCLFCQVRMQIACHGRYGIWRAGHWQQYGWFYSVVGCSEWSICTDRRKAQKDKQHRTPTVCKIWSWQATRHNHFVEHL